MGIHKLNNGILPRTVTYNYVKCPLSDSLVWGFTLITVHE